MELPVSKNEAVEKGGIELNYFKFRHSWNKIKNKKKKLPNLQAVTIPYFQSQKSCSKSPILGKITKFGNIN